ncbi:hypothetical protein PV772_17085 [Pseudarthrobacter sp. CC12]|uniref:hypothetical protein n=1 Tax=Pseudarthrobacter sp. CC12 TaxID=3029193 RepID=UPI0032676939
MTELVGEVAETAISIFNPPHYRVISAKVLNDGSAGSLSNAHIPRRSRSAVRLQGHVFDAVINSSRAGSETSAASAVSR